METASPVIRSARKDDIMASVDLKNSYFHVLIHRAYWNYSHFVCQGTVRQFKVLSVGLSIVPPVFTSLHSDIIVGSQLWDSSTQISQRLAGPSLVQGSTQARLGEFTLYLPRAGYHGELRELGIMVNWESWVSWWTERVGYHGELRQVWTDPRTTNHISEYVDRLSGRESFYDQGSDWKVQVSGGYLPLWGGPFSLKAASSFETYVFTR